MLWIPCLALLMVGATCARGEQGEQYRVQSTNKVPGADAKVEAKRTQGGNTMVEVDVDHLPPPNRVQEDLKRYVVWFVEPDGNVRKAGTLQYDARNRRGRMRATIPNERFEVRITAETGSEVTRPGDVEVARTQVSLVEPITIEEQ